MTGPGCWLRRRGDPRLCAQPARRLLFARREAPFFFKVAYAPTVMGRPARETDRQRVSAAPPPLAPAPEIGEPGAYAYWSTRPLHVLVFLLPLVIAYEIGSAVWLGAGTDAAATIRAEGLLASFFKLFGASGLYLPGVVLVVVLALWHLFSRDSWRVHFSVLLGMMVEAVIWSIPLLVLGQIMQRAFEMGPAVLAATAPVAAPAPAVSHGLATMSMGARATISVGAGLYEELLFRLVGIALLHAVAADLLRIRDGAARVIAVIGSAVAFALYHDVWLPAGGVDPGALAIFVVAGIYFGTVYVLRGFGIVVAVHALYDLAVLVLLPR